MTPRSAPTRLFVYGTLDPAAAPPVIRSAVERLVFVADAWVHGYLYDFGRYAGLRLNPAAPIVHGRVFLLPDDDGQTLYEFDRYEDAHTSRRKASLFRRVTCEALDADGEAYYAWIYEYARPAPADRLLTSGRWLRTLPP